jgi:hypothetical protein
MAADCPVATVTKIPLHRYTRPALIGQLVYAPFSRWTTSLGPTSRPTSNARSSVIVDRHICPPSISHPKPILSSISACAYALNTWVNQLLRSSPLDSLTVAHSSLIGHQVQTSLIGQPIPAPFLSLVILHLLILIIHTAPTEVKTYRPWPPWSTNGRVGHLLLSLVYQQPSPFHHWSFNVCSCLKQILLSIYLQPVWQLILA